MIRIQQLKLSPAHSEPELVKKLVKALKINEKDIISYKISKQSIDARKKNDIKIIYTVDVEVKDELKIIKRVNNNNIMLTNDKKYVFPCSGNEWLDKRPIIIGSGPAGLFCALMLAEHGFKPVLLERGEAVEQRIVSVERFWECGKLNVSSNVQFGEGGAGTFSDGKLNTLVKDKTGRNTFVLEQLVRFGAPKEILYINKPHIGTDILAAVVKNIREHIKALGADVYFNSQVTDFIIENSSVKGVTVNDDLKLESDIVVLAIGHSARDTFELLYNKNINMEAKAFAVGVRIEHHQSMINKSQYGSENPDSLPAASYKVAKTLENGRGVYSFCMCPGGFVVDASSEEGRLAVNGMSYSKRDGENANSAIIVSVTPEDFESMSNSNKSAIENPLIGIEFQRILEERAYKAGDGKVPIQLYKDFKLNRQSTELLSLKPQIKGAYKLSNLREIFPEYISESLITGIEQFDKSIGGFAGDDSILAGVESRTSSPVRITRDENFECNILGIYPCGEGAGYAGGITSAAMDGIKTAEAIAKRYKFG